MNLEKSAIEAPKKFKIKIPLIVVFLFLLCIGFTASHYITLETQKKTFTRNIQFEIRNEVQAVVRSQFDNTVYPKWQDVLTLGEKLISNTRIRGGVIYNNIGEELGSFGLKPTLSISDIKNGDDIVLYSSQRNIMDAYYTNEELGLSEHIIFRVDAGDIPAKVNKHIADELNHFYYKSSVAIIASTVVFIFILILPIIKISSKMKLLRSSPDKAEHYMLKWKRTDEIGIIADSFDKLASRISYLYEEELAAAAQTLDMAAQAVLQFSPDGNLVAVNPSAYELFKVKHFDEISDIITKSKVTFQYDNKEIESSIFELYTYKKVKAMATIKTEDSQYRCFMNTMQVLNKNDEMKRHIVVFHNLSKEMTEIDELQKEAQIRIAEALVSERRRVEAKFLLESCFLIIAQNQPPSADSEASIISLLPDRLLNKWYNEAHDAGLITGRLEHDVLPLVRGDPEILDAVIRQALCLVYARSLYEAPVLKLKAALTKDMEVVFTVIEDKPDPRHSTKRAQDSVHAGQSLATAGLSIAIKKANGRLWDLKLDNFDNAVRFSLPSGEKNSPSKSISDAA